MVLKLTELGQNHCAWNETAILTIHKHPPKICKSNPLTTKWLMLFSNTWEHSSKIKN